MAVLVVGGCGEQPSLKDGVGGCPSEVAALGCDKCAQGGIAVHGRATELCCRVMCRERRGRNSREKDLSCVGCNIPGGRGFVETGTRYCTWAQCQSRDPSSRVPTYLPLVTAPSFLPFHNTHTHTHTHTHHHTHV